MNEINFYNLSFNESIDHDYCIVSLKKEGIIVSYFRYIDESQFNTSQVNFIALSSDLLFDLMIKHKILVESISLSHALYIGKEIYKAELSQILLQIYVQS